MITTSAQKYEPSLRTRQPSSSKRPSRSAISSSCSGQPDDGAGFRVKDGKMLPQDLLFGVSLDPLGAFVPARNMAGRIEKADRVIFDAVDQEPEEIVCRVPGGL